MKQLEIDAKQKMVKRAMWLCGRGRPFKDNRSCLIKTDGRWRG